MKQYIKPVFNIAAWVPNPNPGNTCTTSQEDMELISSILEIPINELAKSDAFAMNEPCKKPFPIEMYCKFTSVSTDGEAGIMAFVS